MINNPQDLYDNKNLQSFRKRKQKQQAEKKDSNFDQHLDDINIGIQALDDIKIVSNVGGEVDMIFSNPSAKFVSLTET